MTGHRGPILFVTPCEQHVDMFLMTCLLPALVRPTDEPPGEPQGVIHLSGGGPDRTVDRQLSACGCHTMADVFERLAPGRFHVQEMEATWGEGSPLWMLGNEPISRVVLLEPDGVSLKPVLELAAKRRIPIAVCRIRGTLLELFLGRRDGKTTREIPLDLKPDDAAAGPPHIGMAATAAGMLTCWLEDLDVRVDRETDRLVRLDLAHPRAEPPARTDGHPLRELDGSMRMVLVSAGGLMSNMALLLAGAYPNLRGQVIDDDTFTPEQWRYWAVRLMSRPVGPKVDRVAELMAAIAPQAHMVPRQQRIDRDNVEALVCREPVDAVITTPDSDICRHVVADALSRRMAQGGRPRAHVLAGARDFAGECYVETPSTAPADEVLKLSDRANADQAAGEVEPTSCADPRAEAGVVICNLIASGLSMVELARVLGGAPATGCFYRYATDRNAIQTHGPFARRAETTIMEACA